MGIDALLMSARRGDRGIMRYARPVWRTVQGARLPVFRPFFGLLYVEWNLRQTWLPLLVKFLYREPLLRYRCERVGARLQMGGTLPFIVGDGRIEIGDDVGIDTKTTWFVGFKVSESAELIIGDRVFIGYNAILSAAKSIRIGDDTMLAGNVKIFDNISHPLSPRRRLAHESFSLDESAPVVIGRNVWIGDGAVIMRGVTIGDNSIVAASAVVTRSVPPNTLVAGNPAVIKKEIGDD
jgi:acetyltransferase-like isoleucine patch superfamily enzyme